MSGNRRHSHFYVISQCVLFVDDSTIHGMGVFALQYIPKGAIIVEYLGERVSANKSDQLETMYKEKSQSTYFLRISVVC